MSYLSAGSPEIRISRSLSSTLCVFSPNYIFYHFETVVSFSPYLEFIWVTEEEAQGVTTPLPMYTEAPAAILKEAVTVPKF
jgi:hypothetical protein